VRGPSEHWNRRIAMIASCAWTAGLLSGCGPEGYELVEDQPRPGIDSPAIEEALEIATYAADRTFQDHGARLAVAARGPRPGTYSLVLSNLSSHPFFVWMTDGVVEVRAERLDPATSTWMDCSTKVCGNERGGGSVAIRELDSVLFDDAVEAARFAPRQWIRFAITPQRFEGSFGSPFELVSRPVLADAE